MSEFLNFRNKFLEITSFLCLIAAFSAQAQQVTCTFIQSPTTPLYNCGSMVTANITISQLSTQFNMIELYYPLQFDMVRLNNVQVTNESNYAVGLLYQNFTYIDPSIPGSNETTVPLKRIRIQLNSTQLNSATIPLEFAVNTCEGAEYPNLENTSLHPMLFDVTATNSSNTVELSGIFTQQVQLFNASGVMKFPTLLPNAATLSTNEPYPHYSQPLEAFDRDFNLTVQGNQFNSISIRLALEQDAQDEGFSVISMTTNDPIGINQTLSIDPITNQNIYNYTITRDQLVNSYGYQFSPTGAAIIIFRHRAKIDCPQPGDILFTSIEATVNCIVTSCEPTQTNILLWNKTFPLNRPIQVASHEVIPGTCISGNIVDNKYIIKFNLPQSHNEVKVSYLDIPFLNNDFNITSVAVSGINGADETIINNPPPPLNPRWEIINNQTLRIWISRLPSNFSAWPGIIAEGQGFKTEGGSHSFEIHVTFDFREEMFKNCVGNSIAGISPYSQSNNFASLRFAPLCVDNTIAVIVNANIPNRINILNQNYILSGGVASPDFTTLLNPDNTLDFNYTINTSGSNNPLAFFSNSNSVGLCANNTSNLTYQFIFKNTLSSLNGTNLLSLNNQGVPIYLTSNIINATINGFDAPGSIDGDQILFTIPQSAFASNFNNVIQIHFSLILNRCPFDEEINPNNESIGYAGAAEFEAEYKVSCTGCPGFYRTLTCIGGDEAFGSYVQFQCIGECNYQTTGDEGAQTNSFDAERISFGWQNKAQYEAYLLNAANHVNKPFNCKTQLLNPSANWQALSQNELTHETSKVYPYDLLLIKSEGTYAPSTIIHQISFEIATNRYEGINPNSSFLELIPGSGFIRVANQGDHSDFLLNDQVDIDPNATLTYGEFSNANNPDAIQIVINVHLLTFHPLNTLALQNHLNTLTSNAEITFYGVFRINPEVALLTNPFGLDPLSTIKPITLRGQFMSAFVASPSESRGSCETYGDVIRVLIPGAVVHTEAENVVSAEIDLPIDESNTNISTYNCNSAQVNNRCISNIAYGIHLFGGFGPTHRDFIEYRPFLNWQNAFHLSSNPPSSLDITANLLYNNVVLPTYPQAGNLASSLINQLSPLMKGDLPENNTYDGLAFSITKESISSFLCPNTDTEPEDDFLIEIDLPSSVFTHLHNENINYNCNVNPPILSSSGISSSIINNTSGFIAENSTLFATPVELSIANDPYAEAMAMSGAINSSDLCERLRGTNDNVNGQQQTLSINEDLSFNLLFGTNAISVGNSNHVWALCRFVDTDGNIINSSPTLNVDPTFLTQNGATLYYSLSNDQVLIHFEIEPNIQLSIPIMSQASAIANCLPSGTELQIVYGMFCEDVVSNQSELNSFFNDPEEYACFSCSRNIPMQQELGINYTAESSIVFEDCKLKWEIDLENPENHLSISNPILRLVLPDGLLISSITPSNLSYTVSGATVIDGPPAPVSTILNINLPNSIWESGTTEHASIEFIFSSELCDNMEFKNGTELSLYVFGTSACDNSQTIQNIPVQGANYPVALSPGIINPNCCAEISAEYNVSNSCPTTDNGILSLNNIVFILPDGPNSLMDIATCSLFVIDALGAQAPVQSFTNVPASGLSNVILGSGQYLLQINIAQTDFSPQFTLFEPFFVIDDPASCPCPCENLSNLNDLIIPPNIVTSTQLFTLMGWPASLGFPREFLCIQLQNDFTIDNSVSFRDCEFKIPSGRKIVINQGATLSLNGCVLSGCEKLWAGIEKIGRLHIFNNSIIKDAYVGIFIKAINSPTELGLIISNSTLENNFVGIMNEPSAGIESFSMGRINFFGGTLLPPFLGSDPSPLGYSFAGAVLRNIPSISVNHLVNFENLHNGIIIHDGEYVDISAHNGPILYNNAPRFTNIGTQPTVSQGSYSGSDYWLSPIDNTGSQQMSLASPARSAIYTRNCDIVKITGNADGSSNFDNVWNGITSVNDGNLTVYHTTMTEVRRTGITHVSNYSSLSINSNSISFTPGKGLAGITVFNPSSNVMGKIQHNRIRGFNYNSPDFPQSSMRRGIFISGNGGATVLSIAHNRISSMHRGIDALNCKKLAAVNNDIDMTELYNTLTWGILLENSVGTMVNCNSIIGINYSLGFPGQQTNNTEQHGIYLKLSPKSSVMDNYLSGTRFGIFSKDNNQSSSFKLNSLNNHENGIFIDLNSRIGHQSYSQNRFTGGFVKHAVDVSLGNWQQQFPGEDPNNPLNPIPAPLFSTFRYGQNQTSTAATLTTPEFNNCSQNYFYTCIPFLNYQFVPLCDNYRARYSQDNTEDEAFNDATLFDKTAKNKLSFSEFDEEYTAKVKQYLASNKEYLRTVLPDTGVYSSLFYSLDVGNETKLHETDLALSTLALDTMILNYLFDLSDSIDFQLKAIYNVDSLFSAGVIDSIAHANSSQNLHSQLKQFQLSQKSELDYLKTIQNVTEAKVKNQSIEAELLLEQYDKTVNNIFLENIAEGKLSLDNTQFAVLLQIAGICPKIGGAAVFKARGIIAMYSDTTFVDDDELCAQQGVQYRIGQTTSIKTESKLVRMFPNPSKNILTVQVKLDVMEPCIIKISNTLGQLIWQGNLTNSETILSHEISTLVPGTYFIEVYNQNRAIRHIEKLVKL